MSLGHLAVSNTVMYHAPSPPMVAQLTHGDSRWTNTDIAILGCIVLPQILRSGTRTRQAGD